jgi:nucleoporin SEH1
MEEARVFQVDHADVIHDAAYNFYGTRMATCSTDHSVKVWDQSKDPSKVWDKSAEFQVCV